METGRNNFSGKHALNLRRQLHKMPTECVIRVEHYDCNDNYFAIILGLVISLYDVYGRNGNSILDYELEIFIACVM